MRFHIGVNVPPNSAMPKKNIVVYVNWVPGLAPRPKYQASQGTTVATQGTPFASHTSATGLVTSGVEETTTMSAWLLRISSRATSEARLGLDWLSLTTTSTSYVLLPTLKPLRYALESRTPLTT